MNAKGNVLFNNDLKKPIWNFQSVYGNVPNLCIQRILELFQTNVSERGIVFLSASASINYNLDIFNKN